MAAANAVFIDDVGFFSSVEDQFRASRNNLDSFHQCSQDWLDRLLDDALPSLEPCDLPPLNNIGAPKELPEEEGDESLRLWCEPTAPDPLFQKVEIPNISEPDDFIIMELHLQLGKSKGSSRRPLDEDQLSVDFDNLIVTPPRSKSNSLRSNEPPIEGVAEDRPVPTAVEGSEPVEPLTLQCSNFGETSFLDLGDGTQMGKRERSMSFEVPTKYCCKTKMQKEEGLGTGRPRRASIRDARQLCYGLRPFQCLMNDIDSGVYELVMNRVAAPRHRKGAEQLLNTELESLASADPSVAPAVVLAIRQVLHAKSSDQLNPVVESALSKDIVSLKELHLSMLSELEAKESETEGCLKEVLVKYSSIHSTSTFGNSKIRLMKALYEEQRAKILQKFRGMVVSLSKASGEAAVVQRPLCMASDVRVDRAVVSPPPDVVQRAAKHRLENRLPAAESSTAMKRKVHGGAPRNKALSGARGSLPKAAADEMRAWLLDNFDKPKPNREEKTSFVKKWKITMKQVEDWFVNARARIVKPITAQLWKEMHPEKAAEI